MYHHLNKRIYKVAFFALVFVLMITPVLPDKFESMMSFLRLNDKMQHFIVFFILSFLLNRASSTIHHRIRNVLALLAFGIFIEIMQYLIPGRSADFFDFVADAVGIAAFQFLFSVYLYFRRKIKS